MALSSSWTSVSLAEYLRLYSSLLLLQSDGSSSDFRSLLCGFGSQHVNILLTRSSEISNSDVM